MYMLDFKGMFSVRSFDSGSASGSGTGAGARAVLHVRTMGKSGFLGSGRVLWLCQRSYGAGALLKRL
jgi:hypothetical protein